MPGNREERPVGPLVESWSECARPVRSSIVGTWGRLEPLDTAKHGHDLFAAVDGCGVVLCGLDLRLGARIVGLVHGRFAHLGNSTGTGGGLWRTLRAVCRP